MQLRFSLSATPRVTRCTARSALRFFQASAHFGFALAKLIGRGALVHTVFEFSYGDPK